MSPRLLTLAVLLAAVGAPALAAQPVALRPEPSDADGVVTLGDLFEGAGDKAGVVVAPGPKGTATVFLEASKVQASARAAGLAWANPTGMRRVVVRGGAATPAVPSPRASATAAEALVYARSLKTGEVLEADDVSWAPVSAHSVPDDAPSDAEAVIGLAARKPLRAGAAVGASDLAAAKVINKNDPVSVHFRGGGVTLMLQGKALTAAAQGDAVRVLNPQSKTIIEAVAVGPGLAVVGREAEILKTQTTLALR